MQEDFDHDFYARELYWLHEWVNDTFKEYYPKGLGLHPSMYPIIDTFIKHTKIWAGPPRPPAPRVWGAPPPTPLSSADKILAQHYVDHFFAELIRLCAFIDDSRIAGFQKNLWILFDYLGEKLPWDLFPLDKQFLYFKSLFQHKAFRTQFIAFFTRGVYQSKIDDSYTVSVPRICHPKLFAFLQAWNTLDAGEEPVPDSVLAGLLPSSVTVDEVSTKNGINPTLPQPMSSTDARSRERIARPSHSNPKVPKPAFQPNLDEAWKSVQETSGRIQVLEDLDEEDQKDLATAQKTAQRAYSHPTQQNVQELKNLSQKFQQKPSSAWVAFGLALLGLAMVLAGALTIAVCVGALSVGFFAPPAVAGTVGGIELMGAGLATIGTAAVTFDDSRSSEKHCVMR